MGKKKTINQKISADLLKYAGKHAKVAVPVLLGAGTFAVDRLFKDSIEKHDDSIYPHPISEKVPSVDLRKAHNDGFAMGRGRENPELVKTAPAVAAGTAALTYAAKPKKTAVGNAGEALLLAGALSNLYDRRTYGYVVDYLHVDKGPLKKIVFNIADAAIAVGGILSQF